MSEPERAGKIEISRRAIASVVADAVAGSYGVVGMAPRNLRDGLDVILRRDHLERGIDVHQRDGRLSVDVYVVVEYGTRITEVGKNLAEAVRFAMEQTLGVEVERVTVNVKGLRLSD